MGDKNMISSSSSSSVYDTRDPSDEITQFLRQILVRSSSPRPSYSPATYEDCPHAPEPRPSASPPSDVLAKRAISAVDLSDGDGSGSAASFRSSGVRFSVDAAAISSAIRRSSSSVGTSGNETDDYDCESEEGMETVVDKLPAKPAPPRSSCKRSRAAEIHNLSEKRRRSRINEKMKALQNLIPNSNKTDKASMLDEAIEYLKQLQLQVQMMTMRNGLGLHPMCLTSGPLHLPQIRPLTTDQFASISNETEIVNLGASYGLDPSGRCHLEPCPVLDSPVEKSKEDSITHHGLNDATHPKTNLLGFEGEEPNLKDNLT